MKKFNEVITVEVSVDTIANNLLATMDETFPHREMMVETIIGSATKFQLGLYYNALNGYTNEIDFKVGQLIVPNKLNIYAYWEGKDQPQSYANVQEAKINEIDIYSSTKLLIEYLHPNSRGEYDKRTQWISHIGCELAVQAEVLA